MQNITGVGGQLILLENQILNATSASRLTASLNLQQNSYSYLPSVFLIPQTATVTVNGQVCGAERVAVYGTIHLSLQAKTCGNPIGNYNFTSVGVFSTGKLLSFSGSNLSPVVLNAQVCQQVGATIATLGLSITPVISTCTYMIKYLKLIRCR